MWYGLVFDTFDVELKVAHLCDQLNSKPFSILPMTCSPPSSFITNASSPLNSVNPSLSRCLRCSLRKPTQFLVMVQANTHWT